MKVVLFGVVPLILLTAFASLSLVLKGSVWGFTPSKTSPEPSRKEGFSNETAFPTTNSSVSSPIVPRHRHRHPLQVTTAIDDPPLKHRRGRRFWSDLERLEGGLQRARAAIQEAMNGSRLKDPDYSPDGPIYRNAKVFHRSYLEMEKQFKVFIYKEGEVPLFHDGPCRMIYTIEGQFINKMEMDHNFRTHDPHHAHAFFLPYSVTRMRHFLPDLRSFGRIISDYVHVVAGKHPHWNRSHGADHFILACHDWGPYSSFYVPELVRNSIRALCNANTSERFDPKKDVSIPEINLRSNKLLGLINGGLSPSKRSILAFFAGGNHGAIRPILFEHWKRKDQDIQVYEYLPKGVSYNDLMRKSKYCLCPSGYEVASPRVVESLYNGCVPVLISKDYVPPFSDVLNWEMFSVMVSIEEIPNLKEILMRIPERQYQRMQKRVVQGIGSLSGYLSLSLREVPPPCRLREVYPPGSKSLVLAGPEDGSGTFIRTLPHIVNHRRKSGSPKVVNRNSAIKGRQCTRREKTEQWDFTRIKVVQNHLPELKMIWERWDGDNKQLFFKKYGDLPYLLDISMDKVLLRALAQFWNPAYNCFTFGSVDLVPTIEEYLSLIRCPRIRTDNPYLKASSSPAFQRKLSKITGKDEQWIAPKIKTKGGTQCIAWKFIQELIQAQHEPVKQVDLLALSIYGLVIFPKSLGYIDDAVVELFSSLHAGVNPVPAMLAETFRSLTACKKAGEGRFIGCAQLLLVWFHSHFWKPEKTTYRACFENYSPLQDLASTPRQENIPHEKWMSVLQNLQEKDVIWKASWFFPENIIYRCEGFDWVPLLGIWGASGYVPLLVSRQYRSRQFIPATRGIATCEFAYGSRDYKKAVSLMIHAWDRIYQMKPFDEKPRVLPEYRLWRNQRLGDSIPVANSECNIPIEEHLQVNFSEMELAKQDFERKYFEMERQISGLTNEKTQLKCQLESQEREMERLRKGKNKANEDLSGLQQDYKKICASAKYAGLGKSPSKWKVEIQGEKDKANHWEKRYRETSSRRLALEQELTKHRAENVNLRGHVIELEESLQEYRDQSSTVNEENELLRSQIDDMEAALQDCQGQIANLKKSGNVMICIGRPSSSDLKVKSKNGTVR
ncbi:hypothetical protein GQ457_01G016130 [Hibiscus cannabinus]